MKKETKLLIEKEMQKTFDGRFWTSLDDMLKDLDYYDGLDASYVCPEYLMVYHVYDDPDDLTEIKLTIGGTGKTLFVKKVEVWE